MYWNLNIKNEYKKKTYEIKQSLNNMVKAHAICHDDNESVGINFKRKKNKKKTFVVNVCIENAVYAV